MLSDKNDHIAALDSAKTSHLTAIQTEGAAQLAPLSALASDFELVNDVPDGSRASWVKLAMCRRI